MVVLIETVLRRLPPPPPAGRTLRWAATLALGSAGGWVASAAGLPLPWLLGALLAVGAAAAGGLRLPGGPLAFPPAVREACIPVIGVLIGGTFAPETLAGAADWWPGLVSAALYVPAALAVNFLLFRRVGGLSRPTAYFAAMPGGLIEAIELGTEAGADPRPLTALQFIRVVLVVTAIPLIYSLIEGRAVGSAAGAGSGGPDAALGLLDALILLASGVVGYRIATRFKLPAGRIIGPIAASALVHATGLTDAAPPAMLVAAAQLVIGTSLGLRFVGMKPAELRGWMRLSALSVAAMLLLAVPFAAVPALLGAAPFGIMLLALAPGGVVEMGLVALSLESSPILVTLHHLARILVAVFVGAGGWRFVGRRG